ncbi:DUF4407 domain-containing protein [Bradyrhizobium manausense]
MTFDPFGPPPDAGLSPDRSPVRVSRIFKLAVSDKVMIKFGGLKTALVEQFGNLSDVVALRNRGAAELALFSYTTAAVTVALDGVFGAQGLFNPVHAAAGAGFAYMFLRMDAFLHVRGLYHAGKQELIKVGAELGSRSEDITWYAALTARAVVGIAQALVVGSIAGQSFFASEINANLAKLSAEKNAAITAENTKTFDRDLATLQEAAKRATDEANLVKKGTDALRAQDVANLREAARQSNRQQLRPGTETARMLTTSALQGYEAKGAAADKKAQDAAKAYADKLASRGNAIRTMTESDPRFVDIGHGFLERLKAVRTLSREDNLVAVGIGLVDVVGIGLELWVLILFIAQCPTRLSVALYCEHLKSTSAAARDLEAAITRRPPEDLPPDEPPPTPSPPRGVPNGERPNPEPPAPEPRRKRGRPRKSPLNGHQPPPLA